MGKFLIGVLTGVIGFGIAEVLAGPEACKELLNAWTSEAHKEKYPSLHKFWNSKSED